MAVERSKWDIVAELAIGIELAIAHTVDAGRVDVWICNALGQPTRRCRMRASRLIVPCLGVLLSACTAPYQIPTDERGSQQIRVPVERTQTSTAQWDPEEPGSTYVVQRGDTLFAIAWRFEQDPLILARRNRIEGDLIRPGDVLQLRGPVPEVAKTTPAPTSSSPIIQGQTIQRPAPVVSEPRPAQPALEARRPPASTTAPTEAPQKTPPVRAMPPASGWQWPVQGPIIERYSTQTRFSRSLQLGGERGAPVRAAASGRVVYAGDGLVGFGNLVILSHPDNYLSAYGHNDAISVTVGQVVTQDAVIAQLGSTGTDRVKLHFEIRKDGTPIDPMKLLPAR